MVHSDGVYSICSSVAFYTRTRHSTFFLLCAAVRKELGKQVVPSDKAHNVCRRPLAAGIEFPTQTKSFQMELGP